MRCSVPASQSRIDRFARSSSKRSGSLRLSFLHGGDVGGILKDIVYGDESGGLLSGNHRPDFSRALNLFEFDVSTIGRHRSVAGGY